MKITVRNKVKMTLLLVIVIGFVGGLSYFIYGVAQMYKINTWQNAIGKELPSKFKEILPLKRSSKAIVSKIIFRSKNIVRPISQLVEKQMNYS